MTAPVTIMCTPICNPTVEQVLGKLTKARRRRVAGIGLALPEAFGDTKELAAFRTWVETDLGLEVFVQNDVTAAANGKACSAPARELDNYLLFYIGAKVHSRLVLNHQIHRSGISAAHDFGLLHFERALGANGVSTEICGAFRKARRTMPKHCRSGGPTASPS